MFSSCKARCAVSEIELVRKERFSWHYCVDKSTIHTYESIVYDKVRYSHWNIPHKIHNHTRADKKLLLFKKLSPNLKT